MRLSLFHPPLPNKRRINSGSKRWPHIKSLETDPRSRHHQFCPPKGGDFEDHLALWWARAAQLKRRYAALESCVNTLSNDYPLSGENANGND